MDIKREQAIRAWQAADEERGDIEDAIAELSLRKWAKVALLEAFAKAAIKEKKARDKLKTYGIHTCDQAFDAYREVMGYTKGVVA